MTRKQHFVGEKLEDGDKKRERGRGWEQQKCEGRGKIDKLEHELNVEEMVICIRIWDGSFARELPV